MQFDDYKDIFGEVNTKYTKTSTTLKEDNVEHKKVLEQLHLFNELCEILPKAHVLPQYMYVRITSVLDDAEVQKAIDEAFQRCKQVFTDTYQTDKLLLLTLTSTKSRAKRAVNEKQTNGDPIVSAISALSLSNSIG